MVGEPGGETILKDTPLYLFGENNELLNEKSKGFLGYSFESISTYSLLMRLFDSNISSFSFILD